MRICMFTLQDPQALWSYANLHFHEIRRLKPLSITLVISTLLQNSRWYMDGSKHVLTSHYGEKYVQRALYCQNDFPFIKKKKKRKMINILWWISSWIERYKNFFLHDLKHDEVHILVTQKMEGTSDWSQINEWIN